MTKTRRWFWQYIGVPLGGAAIAATATIGVGILQVTDDTPAGAEPQSPQPAMVCTDLREEVADNIEEHPAAADILYPSDSVEEQTCEINTYIVQFSDNLEEAEDTPA